MVKAARRSAPSNERLDELYREHPEGFTAGRDQLAKELRAAGDRDEADRVRKLRRPTAGAWLINRAALSSPAQLEEFAQASRQLEDAQARALEGEDEGAAEWRAAAARERDTIRVVVQLGESVATRKVIPPRARPGAGRRDAESRDRRPGASRARPPGPG